MLVVGDNGAGKTNLLEAMHLATQGFSPRTRSEGQLIRFGEPAARLSLSIVRADVRHSITVKLSRAAGKAADLDGARLSSADDLRREFPALIFTPDRLSVVKGGPVVRRAYFDRALGRLSPARSRVPLEYAAALVQRNAALRRAQLGLAPESAVAPWTARIADLGASLAVARADAIAALSPGFGEHAAALGLPDGVLAYTGEPPSVADLEARLKVDIARGTTGAGPHLDDVRISAGNRDLRSFGSQGEQRLALLALLLAEAALLPASPLFLLDDVLSELDSHRQQVLAERVAGIEQTVITATQRSALPAEPAQIVEVSPGQAV